MKRGCIVSFLIGAILVIGVFLLLRVGAEGTYRVAEIDCGENRKVEIRSDIFSEVSQGLLYQVFEAGEPQLRHISFFGSVSFDIRPKSLEWRAITSRDGNVIGITESAHPSVIHVLHDFSSDTMWPSNWNTPREEFNRSRDRMLEAVQINHPDLDLTTADRINVSIGIPEHQ